MSLQMDVQKEEEAFFDKYFPYGGNAQADSAAPATKLEDDDRVTKWRKREDLGHKGEGRRDSRGKGGRYPKRDREPSQSRWGSRRGEDWRPSRHSSDEAELEEIRSCLAQLQRLTLRHEDAISIVASEHSYVLFLRANSACSVVPAMYNAQRAWRDLKQRSPNELSKPMRCSLLACLFKEMVARLANIEAHHESFAILCEKKWVDKSAGAWCYLMWDAERKCLLPDDQRKPMKFDDVTSLVESITTMVASPGLVVRFHPTRPITESMKGDSLTCVLQVSMRDSQAALLHEKLMQLAGLAATQLVGMNLRRDRAGRSVLAQSVAKAIL